MATASPQRKKVVSPGARAHVADVLVEPYLTEKTSVLAERRQYTFIVRTSATKGQVMQAVALRYGVKPMHVAVVRLPGKQVRYGRTTGFRSGLKKAIVSLPEGQSIPFGVKT